MIAVLDKVGETQRLEYEPALPEMGALLAMVKAEGIARQNRANASRDVELIGWKCGVCNCTCSGFYPKEQHKHLEPVYCKASPRRAGSARGEICGGNMSVIHRGDAA